MKSEGKLNDLDSIGEIMINIQQSNLTKNAPLIIAKCLFTEDILKEIDEYKILLQQVIRSPSNLSQHFIRFLVM